MEIGFLPGVTDNVGHTAKETIVDLLHLKKDANLSVYTSRIFLISGKIKPEDAKKIASSFHNPLVERAYIAGADEIKKDGLLLKVPVISGKDSMFNDFKGYDEKGNPVAISIPPTLLISAIGVMPDISKTISPEFKNAGDIIYLLGETFDELGASEYFKMLAREQKSDAIGSNVPQVDLKKNLKTYLTLENAISNNLIFSSISVNSGGLAITLAKACVGGMLGCKVSLKNLPGNFSSTDSVLFSESQGRILISISPKNINKFEKIMIEIPRAQIGKVSRDGKFIINDKNEKKVVETNIKKLFQVYHNFSNKMS